jgi:MFS family permease
LVHQFQLTQHEKERVVSILYLGGGLGAAVGGSLCDYLGRRAGIIMTDVIFIVGAVVLFWAQSLPHLLLGRVIVGFAISVSGIADVTYLHEIAPIEWRGSIVSVNECCISLGFLGAYLVGYVLSWLLPNTGWRTMFGLSGVIAIIQLIGMCHMPESPVWLKEKGRWEEARHVLVRIHDGAYTPTDEDQDHRNGSIITAHSSDHFNASASTSPSYQSITTANTSPQHHHHNEIYSSHYYLMSAVTRPCLSFWYSYLLPCVTSFREVTVRYHRQMWIALFLSVTQQFCGQTNVLNYAPDIFSNVGLVSNKSTLGSTLLIGVVKFLVTIGVIWKIEFLGRRFLLLTGMTIIAFGLFLLTISFLGFHHRQHQPELYQNEVIDDDNSTAPKGGSLYMALPGVLLVVLGYSASFGPLTWLLTSELFPSEIRGRALGGSTIVTYLCASFVTSTFLSAESWMGPSTVFGIYGMITVVGIAFAYLAIPDTGSKSVEAIEGALGSMWWWRHVDATSSYMRSFIMPEDSVDREPPVVMETELS